MMENPELGQLASQAVDYLAAYFSDVAKTVADKTSTVMGKKIAVWLKSKLKSPFEIGALEKLEQSPQSEGNKKTVEGVLLSYLEDNPSLVEELRKLVGETGSTDNSITQTSNQTGPGNSNVQIVGEGNIVGSRNNVK